MKKPQEPGNNRWKLKIALWITLGCLASQMAHATEWVRPGINSSPGVWGIEGGLKFAIPPAGFTSRGGPRGLIRLGFPVLPDGGYDLINFIAVEPVVGGQKGFSELEESQLDNVQGKRIWTDDPEDPGNLWSPEPGVEQLDVLIRVERFLNGAHVFLLVSQRSDAPDEIRLTIRTEPGSASLNHCILSATMGNKVRARQLWLSDDTISSLDLYGDYQGIHFTPHTLYGLSRLRRTPDRGRIAAITTDETEGSIVEPWTAAPHWNYQGVNVTQYWKKMRGTFRDDLHVAVNARYTYWNSQDPIPGGVSYENFEMREGYFEGQQFIFGITTETPEGLGFGQLLIVEPPQSLVAWAGEKIAFSTKVSGDPATFQWEISTDAGETWARITGATAASYVIEEASLANDHDQYRLIVTGHDGSVQVSDAATLRVGDPQGAPTPANVVAHYRFEEGRIGRNATGATDSSGNRHHLLEVIGGPGYSSIVPASALPQTAANNGASLNLADGEHAVQGTDGDSLSQVEWNDFTIEAWVRFDDVSGWQQIVGRDDRGNQNSDAHSLFRLDNTGWNSFRVVAYGRNGQAHFIDTSHIFSPETWTHIAVVGDTAAGTLTAYANGKPVGSVGDFTGLMIPEPRTLWTIGRGQHSGNPMDYVNGQIDEVRFSDAALSPSEFLNFPYAVLTFADHPENATVPAGSGVAFTALACGGGTDPLHYQWQVSEDRGESWFDISGATASSYTVESTAPAEDGNQYRVAASRGGDTALSNAATLSVRAVIEEQPQSAIAWAGENVVFRVKLAEGIATTLQWEVSADNGVTWARIPGAIAESYTIEEVPLASDRNQYRLVVTGPDGSRSFSAAAILRVGDRQAAPTPENVVAHYRFEEGRIGRMATGAIDSSGNGHHLSEVIGGPGYSSSVATNALPQSGENNNVSLDVTGGEHAIHGAEGHSLSQIDWNNFTIEAWVRIMDVDGGQPTGGEDDGGHPSLFRLENTAANQFRATAVGRHGDSFLIDTSHTFIPGHWTHVAVVGDTESGTLTAYANGEPVGSAPNFRGLLMPQPNTRWTIGRSRFMEWANAQIDEVRFSAAALSPVDFLNFPRAVLNFARDPENVTASAGTAAVFSAIADGGGSDPLTHQWQASEDGGVNWSAISGATGASYTNEIVTVAQDANQYRVVASRGGDSVISRAALLTVTPAIQAWSQTHFGTIENVGDAALTSDPDRDGFNNLLEYGLASDPKVAGDALDTVTIGEAGGFLRLTFAHIADPSLIYAIEASDDLMSWAIVKRYEPFTTSGARQYAEALDSWKRRFLRLRIELEE